MINYFISDKKNHLYLHYSLFVCYPNIHYINIQKKKNNSFFYVKRYFSLTTPNNNYSFFKYFSLEEYFHLKNIYKEYENNAKVYNEFFNLFKFDNLKELKEFERYHSGKLEIYKYLMSIGLTLFGKKQRFLQAIIEILNEGENKPISECGIHTISCFRFINNVLAKNINNYLNEIVIKYKYLLVLPEKFDINSINDIYINILDDDITFIFAPSRDLRLLEKKESLLKDNLDLILPIGSKSKVRLRFDPEDSNSFSFVCEVEIDGKSRIFLFDERISSETPWFLNNQQLASLNFDDSISEEVFKVFTTYMEDFIAELVYFLILLRPYKCFKNKDNGCIFCLYYFKLTKFLKDNKFISIEEIEFDKFIILKFILDYSYLEILFILDYLYLEKLSPSLATNFCNYLVEEIDLLIKKQGLYDLLLTYIKNYSKYKFDFFPIVISERNNNQISSKEIFDRIELLLTERFNYKRFYALKLIIFTKENVRLYKLLLILIRVRYNLCQHLKNFLLLLFPRDDSSVEKLNYFDLDNITKLIKIRIINNIIPKIFLHEENIKLFYNFMYLFEDLENLFQINLNVLNINEKTNLTFYHYKKLAGIVHWYLELYQEIVNKVKQKNDFLDDRENIELNQYFRAICRNSTEELVKIKIKNDLQILLKGWIFFDNTSKSYINFLYLNININRHFEDMIYHYSKLETLEEKEKSFLEIQEFVHSLPETNIIVSLFQIYEL